MKYRLKWLLSYFEALMPGLIDLGHFDFPYLRHVRPLPYQLQQLVDLVFVTFKHGMDLAVPGVLHVALHAQHESVAPGERPEADSLYPARHDDVDGLHLASKRKEVRARAAPVYAY